MSDKSENYWRFIEQQNLKKALEPADADPKTVEDKLRPRLLKEKAEAE